MKQKKILFIASEFPPQWGGVATYSYEVAKGFHEKGHQVTVLTGPSSEKQDFEFNVIRIRLGRTGITSVPYLMIHLLRLLKKQSFDHVFCSLWLPGALALWSARKILKLQIPYSISVHAMEIVDSNENLKKRFRQKLSPLKEKCFQEATKIFCVSQYSKKLVEGIISLDPAKVSVVNNGANPKHFFPPSEEPNNPYPRLFSACRLMPNKGIDQVLKSLPDLIKLYPDLQYRVAGDGPDKERLAKLVDMMQLKDHVSFLGKTSLEQLRQEFQQADLFIMLSRKEKHFVEGFGLVFLEAALCKTPSLGGNTGGIPDAIEDQITGWLVDPYSDQAVTDKLKEILGHPDRLKSLGEVAFEKTKNGKTWPHRIEQFCSELGI